jgi:CDP-diacylglycerol--glycerol-3-phosphate 3-phosphatidyltransferase
MEKLNLKQILSLPNEITIIRIVAIPIIILLLFYIDGIYSIITSILFLLVSLTDTLDGYIARRRKLVTTLGKFLDPLADKLLIVTSLIALIPTRGVPAWMVIVIVGREIAVTGLRGIAVSQGIVISASSMGKYKTVFEVVSIFFLIMNGDLFLISFKLIGMILLWIALIIALISGFDYFKNFFKEITT